MDVRFVAGFAVITTDPATDKGLFVETLGLPLRPPVSVPDSEYVYSEDVAGAKHFGVWPLNEAAQTCFGRDTWPDTHPVPQATIEFEYPVPAGSDVLTEIGKCVEFCKIALT